MAELSLVKASKPQKVTRTSNDTIAVTPALLKTWKRPIFQREVKINEKVRTIAEEIKITRVIPGTITLGVWRGETYIIDGQHRLESCKLSGVPEAYADVRYCFVETEQAMAEEFDRLNSVIVRMRPDDHLRALEGDCKALSIIRSKCAFVGYDKVRRSERAPMLSMSVVMRAWAASTVEVPVASGAAKDLAQQMSEEEANFCASYLNTAMQAWGRHENYLRLWGALNLTICAWLYRNLVLRSYSTRAVRLDGPMFRSCLMSLSADETYVDWLAGRCLGEHDRGPCYALVKNLFTNRLVADGMPRKKVALPQPSWASNASSYRR